MGISNSMFTAVSGLSTFGTALSLVSDNIANANSTAFKSGSARFGDLVSGYYATQATEPASQGTGTSLLGVATDFTTGPTMHTGTWSNVMIQGNGFFSVHDANDATLYTRDGTFKVDTAGNLTNLQGYEVLGSDGNEIQIEADPTAPTHIGYSINKVGEIWGTLPNGGGKELIATLRVTTFSNPEGLIRNGANHYYPGSDAGVPVDTIGGTGAAGEIVAGAIEGSNVDLAEQMVNMIIYQADYTANSKAITTANNMLDTVVNLIR